MLILHEEKAGRTFLIRDEPVHTAFFIVLDPNLKLVNIVGRKFAKYRNSQITVSVCSRLQIDR